MNESHLEHIHPHGVMVLFKGIFFNLSPITIPFCIFVLAQNIVIFVDYYKDRSKFESSLFMGIAFVDILKAQGQLILSIISVFVFKGYADIMVLYNSLFYYMITALPGVTCSKIYNMFLSVCLAINMADPFRRLNTVRIRKILFLICSIMTILHIMDTSFAIYGHLKLYNDKDDYHYTSLYLFTMFIFDEPGLLSLLLTICLATGHVHSVCVPNRHFRAAFLFTFTSLCYVLPPMVVFICMIVQIRYLKRSLSDNETLPASARHVSITVFLVSTLFFFCHATVFVTAIVWFSLHPDFVPDIFNVPDDHTLLLMGTVIGLVHFNLPLIYAISYPLIIICRKPELKAKYLGYLKSIGKCFIPPVPTTVNSEE